MRRRDWIERRTRARESGPVRVVAMGSHSVGGCSYRPPRGAARRRLEPVLRQPLQSVRGRKGMPVAPVGDGLFPFFKCRCGCLMLGFYVSADACLEGFLAGLDGPLFGVCGPLSYRPVGRNLAPSARLDCRRMADELPYRPILGPPRRRRPRSHGYPAGASSSRGSDTHVGPSPPRWPQLSTAVDCGGERGRGAGERDLVGAVDAAEQHESIVWRGASEPVLRVGSRKVLVQPTLVIVRLRPTRTGRAVA
jgi:hypothetical protein